MFFKRDVNSNSGIVFYRPPRTFTFSESFEYSAGWNDTIDIATFVSGNAVFTTPDFSESFEYSAGWNDTIDIATFVSGNAIFTSPDFSESFETGSGGW